MKRLLLAVMIAASSTTLARAQTPAVEVTQAWARATPGNALASAVYLTVTDHGAADRITGISTPVAGMAMMHESFVEGGVSKMRMLDDVALPPQTPVVFKPGGMHIMLEELTHKLKAGDTFPITLTFGTAPPVTVTVTVLKAGARAPAATAMPDMPGMKMTP